MGGFNRPSDAERSVLLAFAKSNAIAYPDCDGLSKDDVAAALRSLEQRGLIAGRAPYKLTNKGKRMLKELKQQ